MRSYLVLLILILFVSCDTGKKEMALRNMSIEAPVSGFAAADAVMPQQGRVAEPRDFSQRKLIRNGDIRFQTRDLTATGEFIISSVKRMDGYISGDNTYDSEDRITRRLEIRIPADKFDALADTISSEAKSVEFRNVYLQDVTEEFIDIEARLRTKKELETRYMQLLQKAQKVEEILAIEKELGTLRSDIESIEGRLKYLNDKVSFSTLNAEFYQLKGTANNFSSRLGSAFVEGWRWLIVAFVGLVHLWPFILLLLVAVPVIIKISTRRKKIR